MYLDNWWLKKFIQVVLFPSVSPHVPHITSFETLPGTPPGALHATHHRGRCHRSPPHALEPGADAALRPSPRAPPRPSCRPTHVPDALVPPHATNSVPTARWIIRKVIFLFLKFVFEFKLYEWIWLNLTAWYECNWIWLQITN
jgi:hypothetical protein